MKYFWILLLSLFPVFAFAQAPFQQPSIVSSPSSQEDYQDAVNQQNYQNFLNTAQQNAQNDSNFDPMLSQNQPGGFGNLPSGPTGSFPICEQLFAGDPSGSSAYAQCNEDMQACVSGGGTESRCICKVSGGIVLNTDVPFIGNCINLRGTGIQSPDGTTVTPVNAFPTLMQALSKIIMSVIMVVGFLCILIGGVMITTGDPEGGKNLIKHVVIAMALLGASGTILRLINPNFFG